MEIDVACLCRGATEERGEPSLKGLLRSLSVESLPETLEPFYAVYGYRASAKEAGPHSLKLVLEHRLHGALYRFEKQVTIEQESAQELSFIVLPVSEINLEKSGELILRIEIPELGLTKSLPLGVSVRARRRSLPLVG